jgi:hypothetical protein
MIGTLLVPDNQNVSIKLPQSFIGKQVEVIAFIKGEIVVIPFPSSDLYRFLFPPRTGTLFSRL